LKLATWNVALPVSPKRRMALSALTDAVNADILVLTETHDDFKPGHTYSCSSAEGRDGLHKSEHRWVTIWSKHLLEPISTTDKKRTAAARVVPNQCRPFVVYGTVLPSLGSGWQEHPAMGGVAFRESIKVQTADWKALRRKYPDDEFFLLGDFNQDFVRPRYYGSKVNRILLEAALEDADLVALTAGDNDPARRDSPLYACIDHICAREDSQWRAGVTERWPAEPTPRKKGLSDHFGISASLIRG
jgi:endonuclease/exonuclease/phosphatase family metal-dependent hydrolase